MHCVKVLKTHFQMIPILYYNQKRQWDMMTFLPCESTQKSLPDDTCIVLLPKKAMGHDAIIAMWKYSKILSNDIHIIYYQKRQCPNMYKYHCLAFPHDTCSCHTCLHWNVLKKWCKMMSILCRIHDVIGLALFGLVGFIHLWLYDFFGF